MCVNLRNVEVALLQSCSWRSVYHKLNTWSVVLIYSKTSALICEYLISHLHCFSPSARLLVARSAWPSPLRQKQSSSHSMHIHWWRTGRALLPCRSPFPRKTSWIWDRLVWGAWSPYPEGEESEIWGQATNAPTLADDHVVPAARSERMRWSLQLWGPGDSPHCPPSCMLPLHPLQTCDLLVKDTWAMLNRENGITNEVDLANHRPEGWVLGKLLQDKGLFKGFKEVSRSKLVRINKCWLEYLNWGGGEAKLICLILPLFSLPCTELFKSWKVRIFNLS